MTDSYIDSIINSCKMIKGLEFLNNRHLVGFLEADKFSANEMERFWLNLQNIQQSSITKSEPFPGEMMGLTSEDIVMSSSMLDLLVEYYMVTYETFKF
jgi:hypothetical protein